MESDRGTTDERTGHRDVKTGQEREERRDETGKTSGKGKPVRVAGVPRDIGPGQRRGWGQEEWERMGP